MNGDATTESSGAQQVTHNHELHIITDFAASQDG